MAVVETVQFPLVGWAAWLEATNLLTGEPTPALPDHLRNAIDRLKLYGNNGFGDDFGRRRARTILADLRSDGILDGDTILGAVLAAGVSARGISQLGRLIDRLG